VRGRTVVTMTSDAPEKVDDLAANCYSQREPEARYRQNDEMERVKRGKSSGIG
jgi:hypothetical protein